MQASAGEERIDYGYADQRGSQPGPGHGFQGAARSAGDAGNRAGCVRAVKEDQAREKRVEGDRRLTSGVSLDDNDT